MFPDLTILNDTKLNLVASGTFIKELAMGIMAEYDLPGDDLKSVFSDIAKIPFGTPQPFVPISEIRINSGNQNENNLHLDSFFVFQIL